MQLRLQVPEQLTGKNQQQLTDRPPVVTNTTPLITLAGVELIDLLPLLYGNVWIPRIVEE